jgi:predicted glutamine amidotransferase
MCRALLYLGQPVLLDNLLFQPDSALIRQSYMPKMLHMLNLAGFGMRAWSRSSHLPEQPWSYGVTTLPVFDRNLKAMAEKIEVESLLAHVRGVPYHTRVEISPQNVHPFQFPGVPLALAHNGDLADIERMRPLMVRHIRPRYLSAIRGTTDSEWIYALLLSCFDDGPQDDFLLDSRSLVKAIRRLIGILRALRAELSITISSSMNLFLASRNQIAALRYCFDFGRYHTADPTRVHEANLNYLSLWYTLGGHYGLHEGEWCMQGGTSADSVIIASEPLSRDIHRWVEVPEYGLLVVDGSGGQPELGIHLMD